MSRNRIILSTVDYQRLDSLFTSTLVKAFYDKSYLKDLRTELDIAKIVAPRDVPSDVVTMNSTVQLRDMETKEIETYTLVYPKDANIAEGKLSILAPIGTAIIGYRIGNTIRWNVPSGVSLWRIEGIVFQPERDQVAA